MGKFVDFFKFDLTFLACYIIYGNSFEAFQIMRNFCMDSDLVGISILGI
jgi:hypothetical protein